MRRPLAAAVGADGSASPRAMNDADDGLVSPRPSTMTAASPRPAMTTPSPRLSMSSSSSSPRVHATPAPAPAPATPPTAPSVVASNGSPRTSSHSSSSRRLSSTPLPRFADVADVGDVGESPLVPPYSSPVAHASVVVAAVRAHAAAFEAMLAPARVLVRALLDARAFASGASLREQLVDEVRATAAVGDTLVHVLFSEYARSATADVLGAVTARNVDVLGDGARHRPMLAAQYLGRDEHGLETRDAATARRAVGALVRDEARAREVLVTSVRALVGTYDVYFADAADDDGGAARYTVPGQLPTIVLVIDWTEHAHRLCEVAV